MDIIPRDFFPEFDGGRPLGQRYAATGELLAGLMRIPATMPRKTIIKPAVSLRVEPDGSVTPYLPKEIAFKDDDGKIRPVAPFFELWAKLQSEHGGTVDVPVTLDLLHQFGASPHDISYEITLANHKAARRSGDPACAFSARVVLGGADHVPASCWRSARTPPARSRWCGPNIGSRSEPFRSSSRSGDRTTPPRNTRTSIAAYCACDLLPPRDSSTVRPPPSTGRRRR